MEIYTVLRCLLLGLTAVIGDRLVDVNQHNDLTRALCDNVTHAAIGFITWINVHYSLGRGTTLSYRVLAQCVLCAFISSAIDLDHFISAWSFHLKDATKLLRRPPLHCTTVPMLMFALTLLLAHCFHSSNLEEFSWILITAFLSHHLRDAARHGFWIWPFGSTVPLGSGLYLIMTMVFPFLLSLCMQCSNSSLMRLRPESDIIFLV